jgi:hypothetical protein
MVFKIPVALNHGLSDGAAVSAATSRATRWDVLCA